MASPRRQDETIFIKPAPLADVLLTIHGVIMMTSGNLAGIVMILLGAALVGGAIWANYTLGNANEGKDVFVKREVVNTANLLNMKSYQGSIGV